MAEPISAVSIATAVISPVVQQVWEETSKNIGKKITQAAKSVIDRAFVELRIGFNEYLSASFERCSKFKTILNPYLPLLVKDYYVNVSFENDSVIVSDLNLIQEIKDKKFVVITGLAGGGKSMFMKYMTIQYFENPKGSVPLFVELRHLNNLTNKNILSFIRTHCSLNANNVSEDHFSLSLKAGAFSLILDGFDEINYDSRDDVQAQILDIQKKYPALSIVVSSRPDERFGSWAAFYVYAVKNLSKAQSARLIKSLPYDEGVKKRFQKEVKDKLYESHRSFLSSPLLTTIMLLTYEEFAEIPDKMHVFYSQAFDTLFQKHDAQKEQYQRKTHTELSKDEFKVCFSAFCAISYLEQRFSFDEDILNSTAERAVRYMKQTNEVSYSKLSGKLLIADLRQSVCMLQPDGLDTSFVHRSFQEYFAAVFVTGLHSSKWKKILDKYALRYGDSVMAMARDINRESFEQEWVVPTIQEIRNIFRLGESDLEKNAIRLSMAIEGLRLHLAEGQIFISYTEVKHDVMGAMETLFGLYTKQLGDHFPFFVILRDQDLKKVKEKILTEKNKKEDGFDEIKDFLSKSSESSHHILQLKVTSESDWWLNAFGLEGYFQKLEKNLEKLNKEILGREKRRSIILDEFI